MENLRIEAELERQKSNRGNRAGKIVYLIQRFSVVQLCIFIGTENRDSGVADVEVCPCPCPCAQNQGLIDGSLEEVSHDTTQIKRSALSNSLLDIHEQCKYNFYLGMHK